MVKKLPHLEGIGNFLNNAVLVAFAIFSFSPLFIAPWGTVNAASGSLTKDFHQCANENPTLGDCDWINGILNPNNSQYFEGDDVEQRTLFTNLPATTENVHTLTFSHQFTKGGVHAYDFITSYEQGPSPLNNLNPCDDLQGSLGATCSSLRSGANTYDADAPDDPFVSKDGAVQSKIDAYEAAFGNRTVKIYGSSAISSASISVSHSVANSGDTGDSDTSYTLTWTSSSTEVLIETAGHVSIGDDPVSDGLDWGAGLGASSISGGPYHFKLHLLDGSSIGQRDNQIQSGAILPPPPPPDTTLTVNKVVINDNGGTLTIQDFPLFIGQTQVTSGTSNLVEPGSYVVSETNQFGYSAAISGDCDAQGNVTLIEGDNKICTITNDDIAPTLTVNKVVINDNGGTLTIQDFPLFIGQTQVTSGVSNTLNAGTYVVSETNQTGYAASIGGDCDAQGNVSLSIGQNKTCTITNDDVAPTLTLIKTVVNDNGGNKLVNDFMLFISGQPAVSSQTYVLDAGTYTASEIEDPGYAASDWGGDCTADGTVTLAVGDNKICTITNDDIQPQLIVVKRVVNDNGGTAEVADFALFVNDTQVVSGQANGFNAGTYTVSETGLPGYTGTVSGDCAPDGTVTLSVGDIKTCIITNDDVAPRLTVNKVVVNDNGGDAVTGDFPLFVDVTEVINGATNEFDAGNYLVSETNLPGYTAAIAGDCDAQGNVTLAVGDDKTCTITNDDVAPTITLTKVVVNDNGGNAQISDFTLLLDGSQVTSGAANDVDANTPYEIDEGLIAGYEFVSITGDEKCPGILGGSISSLDEGENVSCTITNTDVSPSITLTKVVINNNGGTLGVNDFGLTIGGTSVSSGGTLDVDANTPITLNELGIAGYSFVSITGDAGCPEQPGGTVTLDEGEHISCTITNDDIPSNITVNKVVDNTGGGTLGVEDFLLFIDQTQVTSGSNNQVDVGTYLISEINQLQYSASYSGDCEEVEGVGVVTVGLDETATCTITNTFIPTSVLVSIEPQTCDEPGSLASPVLITMSENGGAIVTIFDSEGNPVGDPITSTQFVNLAPGTYSFTSVAALGFVLANDVNAEGTFDAEDCPEFLPLLEVLPETGFTAWLAAILIGLASLLVAGMFLQLRGQRVRIK